MPFLRAHWRDLVMINWSIAPERVEPWVPSGCEVDCFQGQTYASLVAFQFRDTRVLGVPVPGHVHFEEVNLRLYVRHTSAAGEIRRGVVFVRELVPRRMIAWVARTLYREPYDYMPMSHRRDVLADGRLELRYQWDDHWVELVAAAESQELVPGSEPHFIAEHYWGYTATPSGTREYRVRHPPWRWRAIESIRREFDMARLYGEAWGDLQSTTPSSQFVAEGSDVEVDPWGQLSNRRSGSP
jgi:uncharacterized protein YqjF (DUF2071 family)